MIVLVALAVLSLVGIIATVRELYVTRPRRIPTR